MSSGSENSLSKFGSKDRIPLAGEFELNNYGTPLLLYGLWKVSELEVSE